MPKKTRPAAEPAAPVTVRDLDEAREALCDLIAGRSLEAALRFVLDIEAAHERCARRICRSTGRCHVSFSSRHDACAGGVPEQAFRTAAIATLFGAAMVGRYIEQVELPGHDERRWQADRDLLGSLP